MVEHSRYNVGGDEGTANSDVLKNKLGITNQKILDDTETVLLNDTYEYFLNLLGNKKLQLNIKLLFDIHKYFLETLYTWAGKTRSVDISKGEVLFAKVQQIEPALHELEKIIKKNLPLENDGIKTVAKKIAIIHCEFNAIHPFREGNGRTIRLFLDLIAIDSGFELIDFGKTKQEEYIQACIAGMSMNYKPMTQVILKGLKKRNAN